MNKYDRFYDEACSEARDVINSWMNEKLRDELQVDDDSSDTKWHEDTDAFLHRFLSPQNSQENLHSLSEINFYQDDEKKAVNQWMNNMHTKLESFTLANYETTEKKKKPIGPKDPRLAMEARQQKVKEARARREEKAKMRLKSNMEKKQSETIAREIVKQEALEKAQREKIEEEAIQREMMKIRKEMQELKKKHKAQSAAEEVASKPNSQAVSHAGQPFAPKQASEVLASETTPESNVNQRQQSENIKNFELFQQQKVTRKYFNHWIKIVLSKRAAMGKAKALADWHILLKTWSAWRKYYFEQTALKDAQIYEENVKQMKIYDHVANMKHRRRLMKKCFDGWKKFVKMEQYSKQLLKEQENTKKKMDALLGMVQSKAVSKKNDLVLQTIEDESFNELDVRSPVSQNRSDSGFQNTHKNSVKQSTPKHAWQVRRSDVQKLTLKQIENMSAHTNKPDDVTKIRYMKSEISQGSNVGDRIKASKTLIAQQREMITQQKQIIEEQKRLLKEKTHSDDGAEVETNVSAHESTKVRVFQPPKRPKSLLAMEKRAEERLKRREELQERKRQAEHERIEKQRQEQEEQRKQEEEEKRKKQEELRRIKQLEIEKENERKAFIAKMQLLRRKADEHYKHSLLRKYGISPWLKLKEDFQSKIEVARFYFETTLSRKVLTSWFKTLRDEREKNQALAQQLYRSLLKRRCFNNWLKYGEAMSILETKADMHYNRILLSTYMRKWDRYVTDERLAYFEKEERACNHDTQRLKKRGFRILLVYKQNLKREQIRSQRIADMRRKVTQLLPDFDPVSSQETF